MTALLILTALAAAELIREYVTGATDAEERGKRCCQDVWGATKSRASWPAIDGDTPDA